MCQGIMFLRCQLDLFDSDKVMPDMQGAILCQKKVQLDLQIMFNKSKFLWFNQGFIFEIFPVYRLSKQIISSSKLIDVLISLNLWNHKTIKFSKIFYLL